VTLSRPILRWAIAVCAIAAVPVLARAYQTRHWPSTELLPLRATLLNGTSVALPDGKPVVVHFWATWCGLCRAEEGSIRRLAKNARVVSVAALSGPASNVQAYVNARGIDFAVAVDAEGLLAERFGVYAYPTTLFIDADGDIIARDVGYVREAGLAARWWFTE
jgi:thiol-disulfide isomerase/thioredoxin